MNSNPKLYKTDKGGGVNPQPIPMKKKKNQHISIHSKTLFKKIRIQKKVTKEINQNDNVTSINKEMHFTSIY